MASSPDSAPTGRPPSSGALGLARVAEGAGWLARRAVRSGRGWPLSVRFGRRVRITGAGVVQFGPEARVNDDVWIHVERGGRLVIGAGTAVGRSSMITVAGYVELGERVLLGPNVLISDNSHGRPGRGLSYIDQPLIVNGNILIERNVWLALGAKVISGREALTVGEGSIVAAGATLRANCAPQSVVR